MLQAETILVRRLASRSKRRRLGAIGEGAAEHFEDVLSDFEGIEQTGKIRGTNRAPPALGSNILTPR
jgi:hypothetical protein